MIHDEALREYKIIVTYHCETMANHLLNIREGLTKYLFPTNMIARQNRSTRHIMRKVQEPKMRQYTKGIKYMKNYLPMLLRSDEIDIIPEEELNNIMLYDITKHRG